MTARPALCIAAVLLSASGLTACDFGGSEGGEGGNSPSATLAETTAPEATVPDTTVSDTMSGSAPSLDLTATASNGCPLHHGRSFSLTPVSPAYASLVASLKACLDEGTTSMWVQNNSFVVWRIDRPYVPPDFGPSGDRTVDAFRELARERAPSHRLLEPKQSVSFPLAEGWELWPDGPATSLWQTLAAMDDVAQSRRMGRIGDVLAVDSKGRKAAVECGMAGWDAAQLLRERKAQSQLAEQAPGLFVQKYVGFGSGASKCGRAVEEWRSSRPRGVPAVRPLGDDMEYRLRAKQLIGSFDDVILDAAKMVARAPF